MMKRLFILIGLPLLMFACTPLNTDFYKNYKEPKDAINSNNIIYTNGAVFLYDYFFVKNGDTLKCQVLDKKPRAYSAWQLIKPKDAVKEFPIIDRYHIKVTGNTFANQTKIEFEEFTASLESMPYAITGTGVIENPTKVWLHPLRVYEFEVTEFSPFPCIHFPLKKGNTWKDTIKAGPFAHFKKWIPNYEKKLLPCVATYTITGKTQLVTALGTLDCFITKSTAVNEYGEGHLTSYFNEKYGFVRLEYLNIDNSQLIIDLVVCQK